MMLSVILLHVLMILLYLKFEQVTDLWPKLELASERESDLRDTVDCGRKWFIYFNAGKTQLVSLVIVV